MNLYTHTMATNFAVTSVYSKANKVLEPKQSGRLRRDKKHKDGVEVSISRGSTNQNHEELLNMLKGQFGQPTYRGYIRRIWPIRYLTGDQFVGYLLELEPMAFNSMLTKDRLSVFNTLD